jgi:magnesium-transporting ATPase (P-type)
MKTLYFDKTGTLTHSAMKVASVFAISEGRMADITEGIGKHPLIVDLFACCNSVEKISNIYEGDEIDLKMFHYARSHIEKADK